MILPANQIVRVPSLLALLPLVPRVLVIVPKLLVDETPAPLQTMPGADEQVAFGLLKRGVLVSPNASARN